MRGRRVLTVVGEAELLRPWYPCLHCHNGQCPADAALDPGVRGMLALVGAKAPFDYGRQQIELLAGIEVTAKAVGRTAEAIGADIAAANDGRFSAPCNYACRLGWANPFLSSMWRWMEPASRW